MVSLAMLCLGWAMQSPGSQTITITRGMQPAWTVGGQYWNVKEAEINPTSPNAPIPNQFLLSAATGGTLLLDFGSLDLVLGPAVTIKRASLVLTSAEGAPPNATTISGINGTWIAPPLSALSTRMKRPIKPKPGETAPPVVVPIGVTWKSRDNQGSGWKSAGLGEADLQPMTVTQTVAENELRIEGLASWVQTMHDRPGTTGGFALRFPKEVNFWSSLSKFGRPRLEIEFEKYAQKDPSPRLVGFKQDGSRLVVTASALLKPAEIKRTKPDGSTETKPITEASPTAEFTVKSDGNAMLPDQFELVTDQGDPVKEDNFLEYFPGAPVVTGVNGSWARWWNHNVCAQSRFSFAPNGATAWINPGGGDTPAPLEAIAQTFGIKSATPASQLPWKDRFAGLFGQGDTRTDAQLLGVMALPAGPYANPLLDSLQLEKNGELSATDVDWLNNKKLTLPSIVLVKLTDIQGRPLGNTEVKIIGADQPLNGEQILTADTGSMVKTAADGLFTMGKISGDTTGRAMIDRCFSFEAKVGAEVARATLKGWQLTDLAVRGNAQALVIEARVNVARGPVNYQSNLALGKVVADSVGSFPAQLVSLVDGNPATQYEFLGKKDAWVEIDLGRDRTIGAVEIDAESMPKEFKILAFNTGDVVEDGFLWADERDWKWTRDFQSTPKAIGGGKPTIYFSNPTKIRKIRIVNLSGEPGKIRSIAVLPVSSAASGQ